MLIFALMKNKPKVLPSIGIIGGGQLGRMFLQNSYRYGNKVVILENSADSPSGQLTHHFIEGSLKDAAAIRKLADQCDVLTYEIEHINADVLLALEEEGKTIIPSPRILKIIQDKGLQKEFYVQNNIPTSPFKIVHHPSEWADAMKELGGGQFAVKSRTDGYDGKGVFLTDYDTFSSQPEMAPFKDSVVVEKFVDCKKELAVIIAVGQDGEVQSYPAVEMAFDPISNLVTYLFTPAEISVSLEQRARDLAIQSVKAFGGAGLFAVELFLDQSDELYVNEIAPRPHNSGHHTIEGAYTSQFDQLFRVLTGLPLGDTTFREPAVMINLVGPAGGSGAYALGNVEQVLKMSGVYIHLYGKEISKPDRKLGHVTILGSTIEEAKKKADQVKDTLKVALIE